MSKFQLIGILVCLLLAYAMYQGWISFIVALVAGCYLYEFYSRWLALLSQPYNYNKINEIIYLLLPRLLVASTAFILIWWLLQSASIAALVAYVILRVVEFALDRYGLFYFRDYQYGLALCELADGAYEAATVHLRQLLQAEPERPSYLYHLALAQLNLKQVEPAQHLLQQIIADAKEREWVLHARSLLAALWQQLQKHDPTSDWLTHQLAILHHRRAIELEQEGQTEAADSHWHKAIANWILLIETDGFWERWPAEREKVYDHPIQTTNIDKVRRDDIHERLIQIHRDVERAYIRQQQKERAAQHKEYRLLLTWERKTAAALRETVDLLRQQGQSVELSVIAGPLMLTHLGLLEQAREVATQAQNVLMPAKAEIVHTLTEYLSPFGRLRLLIEEAQAEEAIAQLKPLFLQDQNNPLIRRLLVDALIEAGKNLASSNAKEAISRWVEALEYEPENKQVPPLLAKLSIEFASKWQRDNIEHAIEILESALSYAPDHKELKQNLSALQSRREKQAVLIEVFR